MPPLDSIQQATVDANAARPDRPAVMAFVTDAKTETALREGLSEAMPDGFEFRRANIRAAIATLATTATPLTLIVDVSGDANPLVALADLSQVVEPDVRVLVVGDREDVNFYREVTHGLGALEYLYKPLIRDVVARHFGPLLGRQTKATSNVHGGRIVTITGVRGGAGTSTIAANLAWYFGVEAKRHTVLLDADLHRGIGAMLLGAKSGPGLRVALENPTRIDELFVERAAQPAAERLHVLAGEERLTEQPTYVDGAAASLLGALQRRYNFVVVDLPFAGQKLDRDVMNLAQQRVLVTTPTLAGIRDTLRLLALPNGAAQSRRAVVVLNRAGMPGGLETSRVIDALKMQPDVIIPDVRRAVEQAATMGVAATSNRGPFRSGMVALASEIGFAQADGDRSSLARRLMWWRK
jgi:pilus assembly protein CpaE